MLFSGVTVAIGLIALVVLPVPFMRSVGYGGMLVPLVSVLVTLTLLPAILLATVGRRVDWPRVRREKSASRAWRAWASGVVRFRWLAAAGALLILGALAVSATGLKLGDAQSDALARRRPAAAAGLADLTRAGIPSGVLTPIEVLVPDRRRNHPPRWTDVPGITRGGRTDRPARGTGTARGCWSFSPATRRAATPARPPSPGGRRTPGGVPGAQVGWTRRRCRRTPNTPSTDRSRSARAHRTGHLHPADPRVPLGAPGTQGGAAQHALPRRHLRRAGPRLAGRPRLERHLGRPATGAITFWVPLMGFAFLYGLSMDYEVFILARMREEYDATGNTHTAIVEGLGRTGRLVTSAALILFLAFLSLATAPSTDIKILATGLGAGILLDATVVRSLLVPATVSLFGRWNWWLPGLGRPPAARTDNSTRHHIHPCPGPPHYGGLNWPAALGRASRGLPAGQRGRGLYTC